MLRQLSPEASKDGCEAGALSGGTAWAKGRGWEVLDHIHGKYWDWQVPQHCEAESSAAPSRRPPEGRSFIFMALLILVGQHPA